MERAESKSIRSAAELNGWERYSAKKEYANQQRRECSFHSLIIRCLLGEYKEGTDLIIDSKRNEAWTVRKILLYLRTTTRTRLFT